MGNSLDGKKRVSAANGDVYDGNCRKGKRNGEGKYSYSNGDEYSGEWRDDMKHGQGVYTHTSGERYVIHRTGESLLVLDLITTILQSRRWHFWRGRGSSCTSYSSMATTRKIYSILTRKCCVASPYTTVPLQSQHMSTQLRLLLQTQMHAWYCVYLFKCEDFVSILQCTVNVYGYHVDLFGKFFS